MSVSVVFNKEEKQSDHQFETEDMSEMIELNNVLENIF